MKLGIHGNGYLHQPSSSVVSAPRTALTDGEDGLRIPKEMINLFRDWLKKIYPELGKKPFSGTRLCWYALRLSLFVTAGRNGVVK